MKQLWTALSQTGVTGHLPPFKAKRVIVANQIALMTVVTYLFFIPITFLLKIKIIPVIIFVLCVPVPGTLLLNKYHHYRAASTYLTIVNGLSLIVWPILLGKESGTQYLLLAFAVGTFLHHTVDEKWEIILGSGLSLVLFGLFSWWSVHHEPFITLPGSTCVILYYMVITATFLILILESYYSFNITNKAESEVEIERQKSDRLLLNVLPREVVEELKRTGNAQPRFYELVTVMFTDFKDFTKIAANLTPDKLVTTLAEYFLYFDSVIESTNLEKLKTIGDSYMCAGGVPIANRTNPVDCVLAALQIQDFARQARSSGTNDPPLNWELRVGVHTGPLVAGVIGGKKFSYDIWGDTVNTASRIETGGVPNEVNISQSTYNHVKDFFECIHRGKLTAKNKGEIDMYFVLGIHPHLSSQDGQPNNRFYELYQNL